MGDCTSSAAHKEQLLLVFFQDVPTALKDTIGKMFPSAELTTYRSQKGVPIPKEIWAKATILVTFTDVPEPEDAPNLKIIHALSAGLDHLLQCPIVKDTNIPIATSSGIHGPPIAEWTVMNWLVASRKYAATYEAQKERRWASQLDYLHGMHDQVGQRLGILGYGSIGRQIARVGAALGMTIHAYTASPRPTPESRKDSGYVIPGTGDPDGTLPSTWHHGADRESVRAFLSTGLDHLVIALPLTPQTTHLLGAEEFAILSTNCRNPRYKPYLTNISRGKVIDQDALIAALKSGQLSGAALDVTDPEPLPSDNPLWDAPNVQISPHISALGDEYFPRSLGILKLNLERLEKGLPLINEYDRRRGY